MANLGYIFTTDLSDSGVHQNLVYNSDNSGNITAIDDYVFSASRVFSYDALNRLTQAVGFFGQNQALVTHDYSYNPIGNILDKGGVAFTYGDAMHPSAVTSISSGKTYSYDANGNMLTGANRSFVWDIDNRVTSVTASGSTTSMFYDYSGTRVRKDGFGGISLYPFQGYEIDPNGVITKFVRIGIESFASKKGNDKFFYHNDHLGSVNVITDIIGTRVQLNEYDPWGGVSRTEGSIDPTHRFNGKELDPESGLYYYGGRYYDQEISQFVSADPFVQSPGDPQNLNRYSYVINNPQNYIDPSGYSFFKFLKKLFGLEKKLFRIFKVAHLDPLGFFELYGPRRANQIKSGLETIGAGVVSIIFQNYAGGAFLIASGIASLAGKSDVSTYLGFAAIATSVYSAAQNNGGVGSGGVGNDYPGGGFGGLMTFAASNERVGQLRSCKVQCYDYYIYGNHNPRRPDRVEIPFSDLDNGVQPVDMPMFNFYKDVMRPGQSLRLILQEIKYSISSMLGSTPVEHQQSTYTGYSARTSLETFHLKGM